MTSFLLQYAKYSLFSWFPLILHLTLWVFFTRNVINGLNLNENVEGICHIENVVGNWKAEGTKSMADRYGIPFEDKMYDVVEWSTDYQEYSSRLRLLDRIIHGILHSAKKIETREIKHKSSNEKSVQEIDRNGIEVKDAEEMDVIEQPKVVEPENALEGNQNLIHHGESAGRSAMLANHEDEVAKILYFSFNPSTKCPASHSATCKSVFGKVKCVHGDSCEELPKYIEYVQCNYEMNVKRRGEDLKLWRCHLALQGEISYKYCFTNPMIECAYQNVKNATMCQMEIDAWTCPSPESESVLHGTTFAVSSVASHLRQPENFSRIENSSFTVISVILGSVSILLILVVCTSTLWSFIKKCNNFRKGKDAEMTEESQLLERDTDQTYLSV